MQYGEKTMSIKVINIFTNRILEFVKGKNQSVIAQTRFYQLTTKINAVGSYRSQPSATSFTQYGMLAILRQTSKLSTSIICKIIFWLIHDI